METRQVVSVFLEHQGRVMIVRRSEQVGSYRGYWSGISGYLEGEPLSHAMVEVREETGLQANQLALVRQAEPIDVTDPVGVIWRIHAFMFSVRDASAIRLDWENVEFRWIFPHELSQFQTVPSLGAVLSALLSPQGP